MRDSYTWGMKARWGATCTAAAVVLGGLAAAPAHAASADGEGSLTSDADLIEMMSDEDLGVESTALDAVISEVHGSADLKRALADEIDGTLDLSRADDADSTTTELSGRETDVLLDEIVRGLPTLEESTGEVTLMAPEGGLEFSLAPVGAVAAGGGDGVAVTTHDEGVFTAVSHVTESLGGQIVTAVDSDEATYVDFALDIPEGYTLQLTDDGGADLVDAAGIEQGRIAAPWAFDEAGAKVATSFELRDGVLRQHFDAENAEGTVVMDPAWYWWVGTTGLCAVAVAPLLATGGAALATRVPKLISYINKLKSNTRIAAAVSKVGGVSAAAKALVKKALFELRAKLPSGVRSRIPQVTLTAKDRAFVSVAWAFVVDNIWDLMGLGSCASLWKEARR